MKHTCVTCCRDTARRVGTDTGEDGGGWFKTKAEESRQERTGGGRDCKSKQDTYKRMNPRVQYNVEQAKVKVLVVFAVVRRKQSIGP